MSGTRDELEVKARVEDPDALVQALETAGARLEYHGEMIDRRYDRDNRLSRRDEVLRLRVYRPAGESTSPATPGVLGWKGKVQRRRGGGYRRREEWETRVADAEAVLAILERLGFEVVLRIDRRIAQYTLHGATIRVEWYPKMDVLVEVEGAPQAIERAVAATGLARERFLPESLPYFVRAYERRTGARARLAQRGGGGGGGNLMSASLKIPMPLRVPEFAPSLGRLIVPRRQREPWVPLDDIREELAGRVLGLGGEGRAAAAREDRETALEATGRRAWATAWEHGVRRAAERVARALDGEIERAGRRVRMPRRQWRRRRLSGAERRAIAARLGTGGGHFVAALDALERAAAAARAASVLDKAAHAEWQEALRTAARRLEAAWLALEAEVEEERARWAPEIEAIAAWRPKVWPVIVLWAPLAVALVWLGLVLGGYLPAPAWLAERLGF